MISGLRLLAAITTFALMTYPSSGASTITVSEVWSRPATATGVVYATIHNSAGKADALLSASSPVAKAVELHETLPASSGTMSSGSMNGAGSMPAMMMRPIPQVLIPAVGSTALKPGGYHIMLIGLHHDLRAGDSFPVMLHFRNAGVVQVTSHVRSMTS